jgi:hypothetical protein
MNNRLTEILVVIFASIFSIVSILEAQTMKNVGLNTKQQSIVTIAAFTAKGNM